LGRASIGELLTAGDDYEIAFTAPPACRARLTAIGAKTKVRLTRIGRTVKGRVVTVRDRNGAPMPIAHAGYTHF
jgi:thiamine-monophosphate kinase